MTDRTSTITLAVADRFSTPLQAFAAALNKAEASTATLAMASKQGADAAAKLAQATDAAARSQKAAGDAAQAHAKQQMAALNEIQQAEKAARDQAEQRRKNFMEGLTAMRDGMAVVAGAAIAFGVAVNKAFEFGREGAVITQTTESFHRMMDVVGAMPGTLDRLRAASRGTVDDLTLMANVQTLLAGTSGTLATSFANAAPQLMEIARAANKVNPTLGDTNFMFESIARGIKRSSPLILDNLGIVVKLGPAYAAYAESIGVATDALTAEQKQIALLNAVLKQGDVLMNQAGDSADSATDSFNRAAAASKNWADMTRGQFAPAMGQLAEEFSEVAETATLLQKAVDRGVISQGEAQKQLALTVFALHDNDEVLRQLTEAERLYQEQLNAVDPFVRNMRLQIEESTVVVDTHSMSVQTLAGYQQALAGHTYDLSEAMARQNDVYDTAEAALRRFNIGQAQQIELETQIKLLTGQLTQEELAREQAIGFLTKQLEMGRITNEQYLEALQHMASGAWTARDAINAIGAAINALPPSGTRWEYEVVTHHYNNTHDVNVSEPGPAAPVNVPSGPNYENNGQYATGGHFTVPAGFFNDSYRMGVEQGEEVSVRTARQQREGTNTTNNNMGGVTIIIQQSPGQSAYAVAEAVERILGSKYDARHRTGG